MARMPGARWLGEHGSRPMGQIDIVCVHTIVGYAPAHAAHFSTHADGTIDQSRDTMFRSAANLNGNPRVIAIENEDKGPRFPEWAGSDVPPLTPEQVEANAEILAWAHLTEGVPLQLCPDSRPGSRGLAYHRQGIDGNFGGYAYPGRVEGGELWTEHFGKVCPGDRRIAQLPQILARAKQIVEGDDMTPEQMNTLADLVVTKLLNATVPSSVTTHESGTRKVAGMLTSTERLAAAAATAAIPNLGPHVQAAVEAALADAVVDVNVNVNTKENPS